jgi:hypothetical protein
MVIYYASHQPLMPIISGQNASDFRCIDFNAIIFFLCLLPLFEETHVRGFTQTKYHFMQAIILLVRNIVKGARFRSAVKVYFVHAANAHKANIK